MAELDNASERLTKSIDYLRLSGVARTHKEIAEKLGYARPNVSAAINGSPKYLTQSFLRRFAAAYSDYINPTWLLDGEGEMERADKSLTRLHIPADRAVVAAGYLGTAIGSLREEECEAHPVVAPFSGYDFTIDVEGDSMIPTLQHHDTIACRWLFPPIEFSPSHIYVIDTANGAVVKRVERKGATLLCHSDNPANEDFTVDDTEVLRIARVIGVLREL